MHSASTDLPTAFIERRLSRALWKLVQVTSETVYLVPTKRLLALLLLFGRLGYPEELLVLTLQTLVTSRVTNQRAANRSPYEIPSLLLVSFYPLRVERTWDVLGWFLDHSLILLYKDQVREDIADVLALVNMTEKQFQGMLGDALVKNLDTIDSWRGNLNDIRNIAAAGDQAYLAAVLRAALESAAYPALFVPDMAVPWLQRHNPSLVPLVALEKALLDRLPDRLIGFNDLEVLIKHPVTRQLHTLVKEYLKQPTQVKQDDLNAQLEAVLSVVGGLGYAYMDAILGGSDFPGLAPPFGRGSLGYDLLEQDRSSVRLRDIHLDRGDRSQESHDPPFPGNVLESVPAPATLAYVRNWPSVVAHRAKFALEYAQGTQVDPQLLHIYGPELWANAFKFNDALNLNLDRVVIDTMTRTCRSF
jgi:hypothetical protein